MSKSNKPEFSKNYFKFKISDLIPSNTKNNKKTIDQAKSLQTTLSLDNQLNNERAFPNIVTPSTSHSTQILNWEEVELNLFSRILSSIKFNSLEEKAVELLGESMINSKDNNSNKSKKKKSYNTYDMRNSIYKDIDNYMSQDLSDDQISTLKELLFKIHKNTNNQKAINPHLKTLLAYCLNPSNNKKVLDFFNKLDFSTKLKLIFEKIKDNGNLFSNLIKDNFKLFEELMQPIFEVASTNYEYACILSKYLANLEKYTLPIKELKYTAISILQFIADKKSGLEFYSLIFKYSDSNFSKNHILEGFKSYLLGSPLSLRGGPKNKKDNDSLIELIIRNSDQEYSKKLLNLFPNYFWSDENWLNALNKICEKLDAAMKKVITDISNSKQQSLAQETQEKSNLSANPMEIEDTLSQTSNGDNSPVQSINLTKRRLHSPFLSLIFDKNTRQIKNNSGTVVGNSEDTLPSNQPKNLPLQFTEYNNPNTSKRFRENYDLNEEPKNKKQKLINSEFINK
ncbi:MAG: hypothetical protein J0H68_03920 [Sphingobacteriia bacterium]|nr:hypothetical protein [Sphingobacteriia bacterium]